MVVARPSLVRQVVEMQDGCHLAPLHLPSRPRLPRDLALYLPLRIACVDVDASIVASGLDAALGYSDLSAVAIALLLYASALRAERVRFERFRRL